MFNLNQKNSFPKKLLLIFLLLNIGIPQALFADVIYLKNGQAMEGVIKDETEDRIVLDVGYGAIDFSRDEIDRIEKDSQAQNKALNESLSGESRLQEEKEMDLLISRVRNKRLLADRYKNDYKRALSELLKEEKKLGELYAEYQETVARHSKAFNPQVKVTKRKKALILGLREKMNELQLAIKRQTLKVREMENSKEITDEKISEATSHFLSAVADLNTSYQNALKSSPEFKKSPGSQRVKKIIDQFNKSWAKKKIPLKKRGKSFLVRAKLNDQITVSLILDTGASIVTFSKDVAEQLGMPTNVQGNETLITLANGTQITGKEVVLDSIEVGGMRETDVRAVIINTPPDKNVQGLLGMSYLSRFFFEIDVKGKNLVLEKFEN